MRSSALRFSRHMVAIGTLVAVLCWLPVLAAGEEKRPLTLNAGEASMIRIDADSAPEVKYIGEPNAFSVQARSATELLVLGVQTGIGTIRVKRDGEPIIYMVAVQGIADPRNPLAAGTAPPALGEGKFSIARDRLADAGVASGGAELDPGAGSVRTETVKSPATSPATAGSAAAAAPPTATGSGPGSATDNRPRPSSAPEPAADGAGEAADPGSRAHAAVISSQAGEQRFASDPVAPVTVDSQAREPGVNGKHYLPTDGIAMMAGTSRVYDFVSPIRRVSIADSKVADIQVVNPHQLMLIGHDPGFTTLVVWDGQGRYQERQVRIEKEGHQQVILNVIVAEINRSKIEHEGIDVSAALTHYGLSLAGLPGNVATPYNAATNLQTSGLSGTSSGGIAPPGGNPFPLLLSNNITYALTAQNSNVNTNSFFQFLEDHSFARILAEPRLLANSGEEAKFLSGGEIPIVIAQALNTSVVFKQFGTSVVFLPTVVGTHDVELVVKPEVSKPDFSQGVQLFGFTVPAFITRRAETAVRMRENQTLIIAGLMLDDTTSDLRKVPYLGDLPFAGALFRSTSYHHIKTELMMSVMPQIVQPIPADGRLALPTERGPMTEGETRTEPLNQPDVTRPRF